MVRMPRREFEKYFKRDERGWDVGTAKGPEWSVLELERVFGWYMEVWAVSRW